LERARYFFLYFAGPHEPLPGRDSYADYWPIFPFSNHFQLGLDVDPAQSRHAGGDIYVPVPTWGIWDFSGRVFWRVQDYNTLVGYHTSPVNMLGLTKDDFIRLMSDPSMHYNRNNQPLLPVAKLPKAFVPMSCRPPMCNPYTQNFALGVSIEHDWGYVNGLDGELDLPVPISKKLAYRLPLSGNIYYRKYNCLVPNNILFFFSLLLNIQSLHPTTLSLSSLRSA
uniref:Exostosin domain-containing protein n=1 Tax=Gongylonema pulchrum TaxID=637853 RepID=A0A183EHB2_9BILA